ncbi:MAG: MFS transporter, partial [bacterium]|nr:MFS transporter [bacterium]
MNNKIIKDLQFYKFCAYGFLKNLRFFEPFLILFFLEMNINYIQIGTLLAVKEITSNLLELPTGMIADSFGRRKSMILSFLSYICSFMVFSFFPGFHFYLIAMLLFACGDAFRTGTHKAMILTYLELKNIKHLKIHYYGHTRGASQLGAALSALLAMAMVLFQGSYRWIFLVSIVPYALELLLMFSYPRELDGHIAPISKNLFTEMKLRFDATGNDFLGLFRNKKSLRGLVSSAAFSGLFKGIKDYLQPLVKQYAIALPLLLTLSKDQRATVLIGLTYFILFLLTSLASRFSGVFADKIKHLSTGMNVTFIAGALCLTLSGVSLGFEGFQLAIALFILFYILQSLRKPLSVGYLSEH